MKSKQRNLLSKIVGGILLIAGIAAVFLYRVEPEEPAEDTVIRPLKYMVIAQDTDRPMLFFPGTVEADREVDLSFEVGGRLLEFPVRRGMVVDEGTVLGRLDPTNFANQVRNVQAELELARSSLARIEQALVVNAVSQEEYARAAAAVQKAEAQLAIHEKALADTVLTARFEGRVSETYVNQFDNVNPGHAVLKLQNIKQLTLAVSVPETYVQWARSGVFEQAPFVVTFDALPEVRYPATLKEYATVADAATRTFRVRFLFEPDDNMFLLPGMTGTLEVEAPDRTSLGSPSLVPLDAVGFVPDGRAFVWALDRTDVEGVYAVRRHFVEPGGRSGAMIEAVGVEPGTLIAVAGIVTLTEGRQVRLLNSFGDVAP